MPRKIHLLSLLLLFMSYDLFCRNMCIEEDSIRVKIVITFNNCTSDTTLTPGPGFSAWIECFGRNIVFDTGSDYLTLLENMTRLGLDYEHVNDIFISHNHWDHIYGLPGVAGVKGFQVNTFVPETSVDAIAQQMPRLKITSVDTFKELYPGIYTTGEISSVYQNTKIAEQSLILEFEDTLIVIVGCSHPGIETIVKNVNTHLPGKKISLLAGGFHLEKKSQDEIKQVSNFLKDSGVGRIAPSHCTGDAAIGFFKKNWGDNFIQLFLGDKYIAK